MNLSSGADASWGCGDDFKLKIVDSTGVEGWSEIFSFTGCEAQLSVPTPPSLTVATSGTSLNLDWNDVSGADSYTLYYAPYPSASPIYSLGMETNTSLAVELPIGTSFYVATTATNVAGESNYSNIEHFTMTENPVQGETINSIYLSGVDPFLLFKASDLPGLSPSSLLATFTRNFYYSLLMGTYGDISIPLMTSFPNSFMQAWGILPSLTLTCYHQAGSNYILPIIIYRPAIDTAAANNLGSLRIDVERDGAYVFGVDSLIASFETERSNWGLETIFSSDDLYAFAVKAHYLYTDDGSKVEAQATDTNFPHELGIYIMSSENQTLEIELELNIFADFFAVLNEKCHVDVIGNL